jgi:hypothetical protein
MKTADKQKKELGGVQAACIRGANHGKKPGHYAHRQPEAHPLLVVARPFASVQP